MRQTFEVPASLEARRPPELRGIARDGVRLLFSDSRTARHEPARFADLPRFLRTGDLLVVNDSATIPAALTAQRSSGAAIALHLSTRISHDLWIAEPRNAPLLAVGERLRLAGGARAELVAPFSQEHPRLWYVRLHLPCDGAAYLARYGRAIRYGYVNDAYPIDYYQTIFSRKPGSVEMPSAARPFSLRAVDALYHANVGIAAITLHCGVASPETHEPPLDERFAVSASTARAVNETRRSGGRVIAVGTTAVRALESAAHPDGTVHSMQGWTSHLVDRARPPRAVDGILTGFHEPRASHLNLLEAFASPHFIDDAYAVALREQFLWHEFGDVHLIL